jgi:hypothetical protein
MVWVGHYSTVQPRLLLAAVSGLVDNHGRKFVHIRQVLITVAAIAFAGAGMAQVVPAAKETGKAVAESSKEAGDNVKAATESEPKKTMDKAKAKVHKAKAKVHRHNAKKDVKAATN